MSIEVYISWVNDVPHNIELVEKVKGDGLMNVPFNPDTNGQAIVRFTKASFVPESMIEDKSGLPEGFDNHRKYNLSRATKIELIKRKQIVLMDDIDFIWSDEERIMAVRIKLNSHKTMFVPVIHNDKFINNAVVRTYLQCSAEDLF
jgi:hypothetical protein